MFLIYFEIEICKSVKLQEKDPTDPKFFKLLLTLSHFCGPGWNKNFISQNYLC